MSWKIIKMELISVIIPYYKKFIYSAIKSALSQTYKNRDYNHLW